MRYPKPDISRFNEIMGELVGTHLLFANSQGFFRFINRVELDEEGMYDPEFSIHMSCSWRVSQHGRILYGCDDSSGDPTYMERERIDESVRQPMLQFLDRLCHGKIVVQSSKICARYDLRMEFNFGYCLRTFAATNSNGEVWRFLRRDTEDQWVFASRDGFIPSSEWRLPEDDTGVQSQRDWVEGRPAPSE